MDKRVQSLAEVLVHYSVKAKSGETVLIRANDLSKPLVIAVYKEALRVGAHPRLSIGFDEVNEVYYREASETQLKHFPNISLYEAKNIDCMIAISSPMNLKGMSGVDPNRLVKRYRTLKPVNEWITTKVRWVIVNYPGAAQAQEAEMGLEEYEDFVYRACLLDWDSKKKEMARIARILEKGAELLIKGRDTELKLRIKGRKFIVGGGEFNMPDGEIFTGPIEDSAQGKICYEFPAIYGGREVAGVRLWFEKGKVIRAQADKNQAFLESMLNSDAGARRIGELGIGLNYLISRFSNDILFDEKIGGSIHLAIGRSYPETGGTNQSAIHWDMIKDLRKGGELILDGKRIQKDGKFLI